jgi:hypothetical protein
MWRQRLGLLVLAAWLVVCVARLSVLAAPPETPPGQAAQPTFDFLRASVPSTAGYLYVLPGEFGQDTGLGPRLRYELYPRVYDDVRASQDEQFVRDLMRRENLRYVVVPDAAEYPADHWTRAPRTWLSRTSLDANSYVLEAASP